MNYKTSTPNEANVNCLEALVGADIKVESTKTHALFPTSEMFSP
jgi:hypothetical protein